MKMFLHLQLPPPHAHAIGGHPRHVSQHAMLPMSEAEEALAMTMNSASVANAGVQADHCPKHGGDRSKDGLGGHGDVTIGNNKDNPSNVTTLAHHPGGVGDHNSANPNSPPGGAPSGQSGTGGPNNGQGNGGQGGKEGGSGNGKKQDPKEIMKKRRERAICIDRVSRVIFPSTFILLNIIYWLVFSEILDAIKYSVGGEEEPHH